MAYHLHLIPATSVMKNLQQACGHHCTSTTEYCCKQLPPATSAPDASHPNGAVSLQDLSKRTVQNLDLEAYWGEGSEDCGYGFQVETPCRPDQASEKDGKRFV